MVAATNPLPITSATINRLVEGYNSFLEIE
jgi:hypothetical protein